MDRKFIHSCKEGVVRIGRQNGRRVTAYIFFLCENIQCVEKRMGEFLNFMEYLPLN